MIDEEIQEDKFEQLLADKQHMELMRALRALIQSINTDKNNDKINDQKNDENIRKSDQKLVLLLGKIEAWVSRPEKELPTPQVTVNNDTKDLTNELKLLRLSMENMVNNQDELIRLASIKPTKLIPKKPYGNIESVSVEYTDIRKVIKQ